MNQCPHLKGTKPCRRGSDCHFLKQGKCWFKHSPEHSQRSSRTMNSMFNFPDFSQERSLQILFGQIKRRKQQKEEEDRRQKQRAEQIKERQRLMERQRLRRIRQREEREEQQERQRLHHIRVRRMMENLRLERDSRKAHDFQWYLSKNKSFKAFEISQEKIHELDQCIICFSSFWDHQDHLRQEFDSFPNNSLKQQQRISNSCQFLRFGSENSLQQLSELKTAQKSSQLILTKKLEAKQCLDSKKYLEMELTELFCKHTFHKECIKKWLLKNPKCPVCRKNFKEHEEYKKFQEEQKEEKKVEKKAEQKPIFSTIRRISSSSVFDLSFRNSMYV